jgi:rSAM/selenodomain-associated transferase 1
MLYPNARILLFCRAPVSGEVKTRMIPRIGIDGAAQLHAALVQRTTSMLLDGQLCPLEIWITPDTGHAFFDPWRDLPNVTLHKQVGGDLGDRMHRAAAEALGRADSVLLIGSDCPAMEREYLLTALSRLEGGDEALLGPAEDGGYVLLGLRHNDPVLFQGVQWGTDSVADDTRARLRDLGWCWGDLDTLWDVDRPEDLDRLEKLGISY